MCFVFSSRTKKLVAKKNISCWKLVQVVSEVHGVYKAAYNSSYLYSKYIRPDHVNIEPVPGLDGNEVHRGYHSYKHKEYLVKVMNQRMGYSIPTKTCLEVFKDTLMKFVIPKGTVYYANGMEYVSELIEMKDNKYD